MGSADEYAVFRRHKLHDYLRTALANKQDLGWISLLVLAVSLGYTLYGEFQRATTPMTAEEASKIAVLSMVLIGVTGYLLFSVYRWIRFRSVTADSIVQGLADQEVDHDTTGVLVVKRVHHSVPQVLVTQDPAWGYLLPYHRVPRRLSSEEAVKEILPRLQALFGATGGTVVHLDGFGSDAVVRMNPAKQSLMKITLNFFALSGADVAKFEAWLRTDGRNFEWKPLAALEDDPQTMNYNSEAITRLVEGRSIDLIPDSVSKIENVQAHLPSDLKVIWNITDRCSFDCSFCATNSGREERRELTFEERVRVAEELLRMPGVSIDVAGGDPLSDPGAKNLIYHLLKYMARGNVTITTTGRALDSLSTPELDALVRQCGKFDISYDFPSGWKNSTRRKHDYNHLNFKSLKRFVDDNVDATVLVTLSDQNTQDEKTIEAMAGELNELKPASITLLRLMPVGRLGYDAYPSSKDYAPHRALEAFAQRLDQPVKLHCAFRAVEDPDCGCNMLREKVGVDHLGNMYACAWAGYLEGVEPVNNPFYLGNLLVDGGVEGIFKSERYYAAERMLKKTKGLGCRVFAYLEGRSTNEFRADPLLLKDGNLPAAS